MHTTVGGGTVVIDDDGAIAPDAITGVYAADHRLLSLLRVGVEGHRLDLLDETGRGPRRRVIHHIVHGGDGARRALLSDGRTVDGGLRIELPLHAFGDRVSVDLTVALAPDFAALLPLR